VPFPENLPPLPSHRSGVPDYRSSDVDMELKKGFFLNIRGQGKLMILKNENILAWITGINFR
jgi:hypothetical protein